MPNCTEISFAWHGTVHTNGYPVLDISAKKYGLRHVGCLAHIRRYSPISGKSPQKSPWPSCSTFRALSDRDPYPRRTTAPPAFRGVIWRARSGQIAHHLPRLVLDKPYRHHPARDGARALGYALNQWSKFLVYVAECTLPPGITSSEA